MQALILFHVHADRSWRRGKCHSTQAPKRFVFGVTWSSMSAVSIALSIDAHEIIIRSTPVCLRDVGLELRGDCLSWKGIGLSCKSSSSLDGPFAIWHHQPKSVSPHATLLNEVFLGGRHLCSWRRGSTRKCCPQLRYVSSGLIWSAHQRDPPAADVLSGGVNRRLCVLLFLRANVAKSSMTRQR